MDRSIRQPFHLDEERITLPKGTAVVLRTDLRAEDDFQCKAGTVGRVEEVSHDTYVIRTPSDRRVTCQRDQLTIQHKDQLRGIVRRQLDWDAMQDRIIHSAVVGSTAWGLVDEESDEDIKGVFLLPFNETNGVWQPADEIQAPDSDAQYWEVQKLVYQGLRGDANTLEALWSPLVKVQTELGAELLATREMFVSRAIFGTFGRYAISQFRKMGAARRRHHVTAAIAALVRAEPDLGQGELEERLSQPGGIPGLDGPAVEGRGSAGKAKRLVQDLYRSFHDRGLITERGYAPLVAYLRSAGAAAPGLEEEPPRWKNAYNLLRLLYSGTRWLREGEPLITVEGDVRAELLRVKQGEVPLDEVLARADELAAEMERAYESTTLPEQPDYEAAHRFLLRCREHAAREWLGRRSHATPAATAPAERVPYTTAERRFEIPEDALRAFLRRYEHLDTVVCGLVGSHSYGFPSPDSDFDLKAIHLAPSSEMLGLERPKETVNFLDTVDGLEMDYTSHEAGSALARLLKGDGNVLERIFSPYQILPVKTDERLSELRFVARANLSRRFHRHYSGFLGGSIKRYQKEGTREVKPLLYMARVTLTGVHLLLEGEVLADLPVLVKSYPLPWVADLLEIKQQAEHATIENDSPLAGFITKLESLLTNALKRSTLPEKPTAVADLNDWLVRHRMR
jgi:predicted nucleotidyltransferase